MFDTTAEDFMGWATRATDAAAQQELLAQTAAATPQTPPLVGDLDTAQLAAVCSALAEILSLAPVGPVTPEVAGALAGELAVLGLIEDPEVVADWIYSLKEKV